MKQLWYDWFRTGNIRGIHAGEIEAILSTDMSKAFDSVHPTLLLAKQKAHGFSESALNLMKSYFDGREKGARVGTATSSRKEIRRGCPKGSSLGPMLWNIYQNDLFYIQYDSHLSEYADDLIKLFIHSFIHSFRAWKTNHYLGKLQKESSPALTK